MVDALQRADTLAEIIRGGIMITEGGPHTPTFEALCAIVKACQEYRDKRRENGAG